MLKQPTPAVLCIYSIFTLSLLGCSDEGSSRAIKWETCPLYYGYEDGGDAECAYVPLPLDWNDPDGKTIDVFIQRYPVAPAKEGRTKALWMLQGGPGASGASFAGTMASLVQTHTDLVVYTTDHRGVGRSARLGCPKYEAESSSSGPIVDELELDNCLLNVQEEWGDGFYQFTATAAAEDIGELISRTSDEQTEVFVYGYSYGTWWTHRYLQLYPDQATGVILDSIVAPDQSLWDADVGYNTTAVDLMATCGADATCSSYLGDAPWERLTDLFDALDDGHCVEVGENEYYSRGFLARILGKLVRSPSRRVLIPALIYRLERCAPEDVEAFTTLVTLLFSESNKDELYSFILAQNIWLSELYGAPGKTHEEVAEIMDALFVAQGSSASMAELRESWPLYPVDEHYGKWAKTTTPVLMLNGTLDPQTPMTMAASAGEHFNGPNQHFFKVPYSTHGTIWYADGQPPGIPCGMWLMLQFIDKPTGDLDSSCLEKIEPPDFEGTSELAKELFGTYHIWDNI